MADRPCPLAALVEEVAGSLGATKLLRTLDVEPTLVADASVEPSRAVLAQALAMLLFGEALRNVSSDARAYVRDRVRRGEKLLLDHGATRTVGGACGALPPGEAMVTRFLLPLGFRRTGVYPLDHLKMIGRSYAHADFPATMPQFFITELLTERFSEGCRAALEAVLASSKDPLEDDSKRLLGRLERDGRLPLPDAARLLRGLLACFGRHHDEPTLAGYERLLEESPELAWFATEGNAFNHFTDRVSDVHAVAAEQKRLGRQLKESVEVSASGRIAQTSFRASQVERLFVDGSGALVTRSVPGSFQELITRHRLPDGELDLGFDAANAQKLMISMTEQPA